MKVTIQCMFWSILPQSTIVPNVVTVTLIVSEPHGNVAFWPLTWHCDLDLGWRSPYKPIFWSALPQGNIVPNLMSVALIVSEKNGKVTFFTFDRYHLTLALGEGHHTMIILKHLAPRYHFAKFDLRSFNSFWENGKVVFFTFDHEYLTLTLGEGHHTLFWSTLPQGTIMPNLISVALEVSEKYGNVTI